MASTRRHWPRFCKSKLEMPQHPMRAQYDARMAARGELVSTRQ